VARQFSEEVISALASVKHISPERISLEMSLKDLGVDSLDTFTILFEIEKRLNISVPDEQIYSIQTVRDIVERVGQLVANTNLPSATPEGVQ
jgi:acyl carrier protein